MSLRHAKLTFRLLVTRFEMGYGLIYSLYLEGHWDYIYNKYMVNITSQKPM